MNVKLIWATPEADNIIGYCARVSNPANQDNPDVAGLLRYCAKNAHWSVFEMANACIEIETTRDIGRQILRHRSFSFQEFSQRKAEVWDFAKKSYDWALKEGIAKEQARAILPEGLTPSRLYVNGTLRSWITYCQVLTDPSTQKEHRQIALQVVQVLRQVAPIIMNAFFPEQA